MATYRVYILQFIITTIIVHVSMYQYEQIWVYMYIDIDTSGEKGEESRIERYFD